MKKAFYDLCAAAEASAKKGNKEETYNLLKEAKSFALEESQKARARLEISTATQYMECFWYVAMSCGEDLGLVANAPQSNLALQAVIEFTPQPPKPKSSLNYRWGKRQEVPESHRPFAWPRLHSESN